MNGSPRLLIVGNDGGTNVGASLARAARRLQLPATLIDMRAAYDAPRPIARFNWWVRDRRPSRLRSFSAAVAGECRRGASALIAAGLAPLNAEAIDGARRYGVETTIFLTDDPWNRSFRSQWLLDALPLYDRVFTPRRSNLDDLRRHGCRNVAYLPFGYDPELFFPDPPCGRDRHRYASDVFFAGGADDERRPFISALVRAGLTVGLYGDYWHRFSETRSITRGHGTPADLRHAIASAKVCLGLVRRANRDGHAMRSIEVPAAGGCFLVERTDEHEVLFGADGQAVRYFASEDEMVRRTRELLEDDALRERLATAARRLIESGGFTYDDRLETLAGRAAAASARTYEQAGSL